MSHEDMLSLRTFIFSILFVFLNWGPASWADKESSFLVLGVSEEASWEEIKDAYREKVRRYHPDGLGSSETTAQFIHVQKAYEEFKQLKKEGFFEHRGPSFEHLEMRFWKNFELALEDFRLKKQYEAENHFEVTRQILAQMRNIRFQEGMANSHRAAEILLQMALETQDSHAEQELYALAFKFKTSCDDFLK